MPLYPANPHRETFFLRTLVEEIAQPLGSHCEELAIRIEIDIPSQQTMVADRELLRRAIRNLLLNAIDAMPDGGTLTVTSAVSAGALELEIADTGEMLSEEERHQVFELLPTAQRGGTGWGLAIVQRIAELHGGSVTAANCPEGGAAFTLRIPRVAVMEAAA